MKFPDITVEKFGREKRLIRKSGTEQHGGKRMERVSD